MLVSNDGGVVRLQESDRWKYVGLAALFVVAVVVCGMALTKPAAPASDFTPAPLPTSAAPLRVAVMGDSITEGSSPAFNEGRIGPVSWFTYLDNVTYAGGFVEHGATTERILANAKPVDADVLVILAGTNDCSKFPFSQSAANLQAIVNKAGVKRVVVSSIPPRDTDSGLATAYNQQLEPFVKAQGWEFVDAAAGLRSGDHYAAGLGGTDGVHPTEAGEKVIGEAIGAALRR